MRNTDMIPVQLPVGKGETAKADQVPISEAKNRLAQLVDRVRDHERVVITRNDRPAAVLLSFEDYTEMAKAIPDPLAALEKRFEGLLSEIGRSAATGSAALSRATPEELGNAAHAAARKRGKNA
jgi:prevent-host-death family protein